MTPKIAANDSHEAGAPSNLSKLPPCTAHLMRLLRVTEVMYLEKVPFQNQFPKIKPFHLLYRVGRGHDGSLKLSSIEAHFVHAYLEFSVRRRRAVAGPTMAETASTIQQL